MGCPKPLKHPNPPHFSSLCKNNALILSIFSQLEALLGFGPFSSSS